MLDLLIDVWGVALKVLGLMSPAVFLVMWLQYKDFGQPRIRLQDIMPEIRELEEKKQSLVKNNGLTNAPISVGDEVLQSKPMKEIPCDLAPSFTEQEQAMLCVLAGLWLFPGEGKCQIKKVPTKRGD